MVLPTSPGTTSECGASAPTSKGNGWNYRVMRRADPDGLPIYGIHEVFYLAGGKINGWTEQNVGALADTRDDLLSVLAMMTDALGHDVLDYETGAPIEDAKQLSDDLRRALRSVKQDLFEVELPFEIRAPNEGGLAASKAAASAERLTLEDEH